MWHELVTKMPDVWALYRKAGFAIAVVLPLWLDHGRQEPGKGEEMRVIQDNALALVTIYQEAQGETFEGKLAVAEVIRNRMRKKYASDGTVAGTVLRPLQFSGWNAKDPGRVRAAMIDDSDPIVADCARAWVMAVHGGSDTVKGAVLYYNPSIITETPEWALPDSAIEVARVGHHVFFIPKVRGAVQV